MTRFAWVLALAALAGAARDVPLDIEEREVRYRVPGDDLEDLRDALRSQALSGKAGGSPGRTHSRIRIRYAPDPVAGGCRAKDPGVDLEITTTLPEWQPGGRAPAGLVERWQAVAAALQDHEARHRAHALAAARDLQATLARLGVQPDCHALRGEIDRAFLRVKTKAEYRDARYDARTRNGLEEGIEL